MVKMINKHQIKIIHTLVSKCGIQDFDYREKLNEMFNVRTCKKLTQKQANVFILDLRQHAAALGLDDQSYKLNPRPGMATPKQISKILAMWRDVSWATNAEARQKALRQFLENRFGFSDVNFVPFESAHKIIAALEAMQKQGKGNYFCKDSVTGITTPISPKRIRKHAEEIGFPDEAMKFLNEKGMMQINNKIYIKKSKKLDEEISNDRSNDKRSSSN